MFRSTNTLRFISCSCNSSEQINRVAGMSIPCSHLETQAGRGPTLISMWPPQMPGSWIWLAGKELGGVCVRGLWARTVMVLMASSHSPLTGTHFHSFVVLEEKRLVLACSQQPHSQKPRFWFQSHNFFLFFFWPHPRHMEVSRLEVESELQFPAYATTIRIQATSATHTTAQGNAITLTHWAGSRIKPASSWIPVGFITAEPQWEHPESWLLDLGNS